MPQLVQTDLDLIRAAAAGVSIKAVRNLQRHMRLTNREMSEVLSISESTLTRRENAQSPLTRDESEKAIQLSAVVVKGLEVFENEPDFHRWLQQENPALGGERPQALLSSALGREQVREILGRIQWGIFS
jgi:putative toxin-antitoxin system antitoxin component (TIGR02293 family)